MTKAIANKKATKSLEGNRFNGITEIHAPTASNATRAAAIGVRKPARSEVPAMTESKPAIHVPTAGPGFSVSCTPP